MGNETVLAEKPEVADVEYTPEQLAALVENKAHALGATSSDDALDKIARGEVPDSLAATTFKALYRLLHG